VLAINNKQTKLDISCKMFSELSQLTVDTVDQRCNKCENRLPWGSWANFDYFKKDELHTVFYTCLSSEFESTELLKFNLNYNAAGKSH
jgi:hypothetical protein